MIAIEVDSVLLPGSFRKNDAIAEVSNSSKYITCKNFLCSVGFI